MKKGDAVAMVSMMEIRYPPILQGKWFDSARRLIDACPAEYRQSVLDEIFAMHARGKVRSPLGLLKSLVDKAGKGQFSPNLSLLIRLASRTNNNSGVCVKHSSTGADSVPKPLAVASESGRETLSRLREALKPDGS